MNKIWQQEVNNIINKDGLNFKEAFHHIPKEKFQKSKKENVIMLQ